MTKEKFIYLGKLAIGFGFSSELWHIERKNGGKVVSYLHFGFTPDLNPNQKFRASLLVFTLLWFTARVGIVKWQREI